MESMLSNVFKNQIKRGISVHNSVLAKSEVKNAGYVFLSLTARRAVKKKRILTKFAENDRKTKYNGAGHLSATCTKEIGTAL